MSRVSRGMIQSPRYRIQVWDKQKITVAEEHTAGKWMSCSQHHFPPCTKLNSHSTVQPIKRGGATALQVAWLSLVASSSSALSLMASCNCPSSAQNLWVPSCSCASSFPSSAGHSSDCPLATPPLCLASLLVARSLWQSPNVPPHLPPTSLEQAFLSL